jgi:glycyl-tRNA synthetase beta chain
MNDTVLIELRSEELPPKSLNLLSEAFADGVFSALRAQEFIASDSVCTPYATPRRLALTITGVADRQPDRVLEKKGPAVAGALDAAGNPTKALEGFMRAAGVTFAQLHQVADGKGEYFVARREKKGEELSAHLPEIVAQALRKLPIPKVMRWGDSEHQFVRPVHGLILLHGDRVVAGEVLAAGRPWVTASCRPARSPSATRTSMLPGWLRARSSPRLPSGGRRSRRNSTRLPGNSTPA